MNPNISSIKFKCVFNTSFGQELRIVGNIEELGTNFFIKGCWEPEKSMKMETNSQIYPTWTSSCEITLPKGVSILYKYIIYDKKHKVYIWESLPNNINRKYQAVSPGLTTINDHQGKLQSYYEKASDEVIMKEDTYFHDSIKDINKFVKKTSNLVGFYLI
jgi:hypothetical protein